MGAPKWPPIPPHKYRRGAEAALRAESRGRELLVGRYAMRVVRAERVGSAGWHLPKRDAAAGGDLAHHVVYLAHGGADAFGGLAGGLAVVAHLQQLGAAEDDGERVVDPVAE